MRKDDTRSNTTPLITEAMLLAYIDGSLAEAQRLAVEARLERDPAMAAKVAAYRAQNEALHALFDRHLGEPLDPVVTGLESELRKARRPAVRRRVAWRPAALAASAALVAFLGGFALADYRGRAPTGPVVVAKQQVPVAEKTAGIMPAGGAALVSPAGFRPPDFADLGLRLTGERQLGNAATAVTQLTYERLDGRWVSLYVGTDAAGDTPLRAIYPDGRAVLAWRKDGLAYSLVGTIGRDAMMAIAATVNDSAGTAARSPIIPKALPDPANGLRPAKPAEALPPPSIPAAPAIAPNPANRPDGTAPRARDEGAA
jgi:anti-sigma factor RsiW